VALTAVAVLAVGLAFASDPFSDQKAVVPLLPPWLKSTESLTLNRVFGGSRPIHIFYTSYPRKIEVTFEFKRVVICRTCSAPTEATQPRGRLIRMSYDRRTHLFLAADGMTFCESRGGLPPRSLCLRN